MRSRRPMIFILTPFVTQRATSEIRYRRKSRMSRLTSRDGLRQLSAENAYSVSVPMPQSGAASTILRTVRAPAMCPAVRS